MTSRQLLLYLDTIYGGDWNKIYNHIKDKKSINASDEEVSNLKSKYNFTTLQDSDYPSKLKFIKTPPFVLFYEGDLSILKKMKLTLSLGSTIEDLSDDKLIQCFDDYIDVANGKLKIRLTCKNKGFLSFSTAFGLADNIILGRGLTEALEDNYFKSYIDYLLNYSGMKKKFFVEPTEKPSINNEFIKKGISLIDRASDLENNED